MSNTYTQNVLRQHPKTINRSFAAKTRADNLTVPANASSVDITSVLTALLAGKAYNGANLPLRVSNGKADFTGEGILLAGIVDVYSAVSNQKLAYETVDRGDQFEIYGRITEASGVYTLSFYYVDLAAVEHSIGLNENVSFEFDYAYKFEDLPVNFATSVLTRNVQQDPSAPKAITQKLVVEEITFSADNVLQGLSHRPLSGTAKVNYTGHVLHEKRGDFTIVTTQDSTNPLVFYFTLNTYAANGTKGNGTWVPATAGYTIESGEKVIVEYVTLEEVTYGT